ncbi:MAG: dihydrofolate reductase family protein [Solirubrobacteraceae bacterium]|jgi:riboflavin biosynthesis pyrimidine reductase
MNAPAGQNPSAAAAAPVRLARLLPAGAPGTIAEIIEELGLWARHDTMPARPHVMLNMISTVDGRATLDGRSGALSNRADRALFHGLRSAVDAVLVGAGTVRSERYGRIIPDASRRRRRRSRELSEEPLACIVSARMALEPAIPLLGEPAARVVILTASAASLPATAAHVDYVRAGRDGQLDLAAALAELGERFGVQSVLCEGGPHLGLRLLEDGLVDELFLSLSPQLAGGEAVGGESLRILAGAELAPPVELELLGVLSGGSELFLRYGVSARERVSRETTLSSSLAS